MTHTTSECSDLRRYAICPVDVKVVELAAAFDPPAFIPLRNDFRHQEARQSSLKKVIASFYWFIGWKQPASSSSATCSSTFYCAINFLSLLLPSLCETLERKSRAHSEKKKCLKWHQRHSDVKIVARNKKPRRSDGILFITKQLGRRRNEWRLFISKVCTWETSGNFISLIFLCLICLKTQKQ